MKKQTDNKPHIMTADELGQSQIHSGRKGYTITPNCFFSLGLSASEFMVLSFIASHATLERKRLSVSYIVKGTGLSISTVKRAKKVLIDRQIVGIFEICRNTEPRIDVEFKKIERMLTDKPAVREVKDESDIKELGIDMDVEDIKLFEFTKCAENRKSFGGTSPIDVRRQINVGEEFIKNSKDFIQ